MKMLQGSLNRAFPLLLLAPFSIAEADSNIPTDSLTDFSLEQLLNIEVTSVSKKKQRLDTAASAVYVITQADIKNAGVTNMPDILAMAPGINVNRIDANKWAVTARGFNGRFANKLLVLMDGRTLYSPSYSGVYWEAQDMLLDNIERIEIIRGPGATIWGANAVNGVINIITKNAMDTQGWQVSSGGGSHVNRQATGRWGGNISDNTSFRVNAKGTKYGEFKGDGNVDANDEWGIANAGFRFDHEVNSGNVMSLSADAFRSNLNQKITIARTAAPFSETLIDDVYHAGYNLNYNWLVDHGEAGQYELRAYYDYNIREQNLSDHSVRIFDIDMTARRILFDDHDVQFGAGFRHIGDKFSMAETISFAPFRLTETEANAFIQDEIEVIDDRLYVTLGTKIEKTRFTKADIQPSARFVYKSDSGTIWGSVSRALRTPSRIEHDATVLSQAFAGLPPTKIMVLGDESFESEELMAYELGYRNDYKRFSLDVSTFYNDYKNIRSFDLSTTFDGTFAVVSNAYRNSVKARTYGVEMSSKWYINEVSSVQFSYTHQETDIGWRMSNESTSNTDMPRDIISVFNSNDITDDFNATLWLTYQSKTKFFSVIDPSKLSENSRANAHLSLTYKYNDNLELQLVGRNLLQEKHLEYLQETYTHATYVPRSVFAKATLRF